MKKILPLVLFCLSTLTFTSIAQTSVTCNANFTWQQSGTTVKFLPELTTSNTYTFREWIFGDGSISVTEISPYHTFPATGGTFKVTQFTYIYNPNYVELCRDSVTKEITIQPDCVIPDFVYQADTTNFLKINFTNRSLSYNSADSIAWMFGDGSTSDGINPTHTYANAGVYHVCLLIKKRNSTTNCVREKCYEVAVSRPCDLQTDFNWQKDPSTFNKVYFVNATKNFSPTDSITWSFGDGVLSHDINPVHIYPNARNYTVCLWVKRNSNVPGINDCTSTQCKVLGIAPADCNIVPDFTWAADTSISNKINFATNTPGLTAVDSVKWSTGGWVFSRGLNPSVTFSVSGTYVVTMEIKRIDPLTGQVICIKTVSKEVQTRSTCKFIPSFSVRNDSAIGNPYKFYFVNTSPELDPYDSVKWTYGDGTQSYHNEKAPDHIYANTGTYTVCMLIFKRTNDYQITDCKKYVCKTIVVTAPTSQCNFTAGYTDTADAVNRKKINFTATSSLPVGTTGEVNWSFGDNTATVSGWTATHEYAQPGKYYVCVKIQYSNTCYKYKCDSITVIDNPLPCDFTTGFTTTTYTSNKKLLSFAATSSLPSSDTAQTIVNWFFGDNTNESGWTATHEYAQAGKYYVCMSIRYGTNCVKYKCDSITVLDNITPCDFTAGYADTADATNKKKINFTAKSTLLGLANAVVNWTFGDGSPTGTGWTATHEYAQAGKYYVCVRIQYSATCVKYKCDSIIVADNIPVCDFQPGYTWTKDASNSKLISFTNTTLLPTTTGVVVNWAFGDGSPTVTAWNAIHEYAQPGKYYVCLRVQYSTTCVKYKCDSITVIAPSIDCDQLSLYSFQPSSVSQLYYFMPTNQRSDVQYTWTFGDGMGSHDMISSHHFAEYGNYQVCLTAYKNTNCASTTCKTIRITPPVNCDTIKVTYGYRTDQYMINKIYLYAISNVPVQQQTWTIKKLNSTDSAVRINQNNPLYDFADTGYYSVCLRAVTNGGCVKEYCDVIHISALASVCELQAFPNPVTNQLSVYVQLTAQETIHAYVYNVQNVLVMQKDQQGISGNNLVSINTENLVAGYYTLKLIYGNRICFAKFQKM